ncbi:MAG: methyltransferase [Armatimonadota bacterium]|nr:MAG: methyltransferase [Armatimonadota bacterium]
MDTKPLSQYLSFDRVADDYDATRFLPELVREAVVEQIFSAASLASGDWFVDAGVGTGRFALPMAGRGVNVLGIDVSRNMMRQLLRKNPPANLYLVQADLRRLPVRSCSVSAVLVAHVLHLIADWRAVLWECRRVLRRDGVLFLLYEGGKRFPAREHYIHLAGERGLLRPTLGAQSADEALDFVRESGGVVTLIEHPSLHWQARRTHREVLQELERRTYSQIWDIPDEAHQDLMQQTLRYVREQFGSEQETCTVEAEVKLYAARF